MDLSGENPLIRQMLTPEQNGAIFGPSNRVFRLSCPRKRRIRSGSVIFWPSDGISLMLSRLRRFDSRHSRF
jgi:hypothetical protein